MPSKYTDAEVERGLTALAIQGGNTKRATDMCGVPRSTLRAWKSTHAERLQRIQQERLPEIYARVASEFEGLIRKGIDVQDKILSRLQEEVPELEPRDLAKTLQSTGITTGVATDKARLLRGEPTQVISTVEEYETIKEKWRRRGIDIVEGTARELEKGEDDNGQRG